MSQQIYCSASGSTSGNSVGRINILNYLIDAEQFFIVNVDPRLDEIFGKGTVGYVESMCELYIEDMYY